MNLQLLADRVLIEPIEEETQAGFVIPEEYRTFRIGTVVAVGNGKRTKKGGQRIPIQIEVGSKVALSTDYRMPIEIEGKHYFLVSSEKVMAVIP
jgi:chaperonin GroES